jgi:hypothetical protein
MKSIARRRFVEDYYGKSNGKANGKANGRTHGED